MTMNKRTKVVVSVCGVILAVLVIVLLVLFEPWPVYTEQDMNLPNSLGSATATMDTPAW